MSLHAERSGGHIPAVDGSGLAKSIAISVEERNETIQQLAKAFTNQSALSTIGQNPFHADPGSKLDPNGENFNSRAWCKAMLQMHTNDEKAHPLRSLGVCFSDLSVHGFGFDTDYQKSVGNIWLEGPGLIRNLIGNAQRKIDILQGLDGLVEAGEMLVVLGPPGSGCSTFLRTVAGETDGFYLGDGSQLSYQGVSANEMSQYFKGEAIYTAENDVHFPKLTVGDTLLFAAHARAPRHIPGGATRNQYAEHVRDVIMASFGISHTKNTIVGNDFIRGVSGGERKRVSIAEACLSQAPLQCWDNSTRGLDSANAIEFCKTLRMQTDINGATACVAIYQAPQAAYDYFDKVLLLYEGRQIFFGRTAEAKQYFLDMGFTCPDRQTDADFLTSMTSPLERTVCAGFEDRVPRTPDEFAARWKASTQHAEVMLAIEAYRTKYPLRGEHFEQFKQSRRAQQARVQRWKSPYTLSYAQQVKLTLWRGWIRLKADPNVTVSSLIGNAIVALIVGSLFYNLKDDTGSFFPRGSLIFFSCVMNALGCGLEMLTLYAQRPIVEKHDRYALYHPSAEAWASMLMDMPYKIANTIFFNTVLYFMTNLRRESGAFFFFLFVNFVETLAMSHVFRAAASISRTVTQAMAPAAVMILMLTMYSGFALPTRYMLGWAKWISYINPINYAFKSLMVNEFNEREFPCVNYVPAGPAYHDAAASNHVCSTVGSVPGEPNVSGDAFILSSFDYVPADKWRNVGYLFAYAFVMLIIYMIAAETVTAKKSKGEILVFRRNAFKKSKYQADEERGKSRRVVTANIKSNDLAMIEPQTSIFQWKDVCYDIKIGKEERRILDHVDGWVKPGTLTALMGVSGAGKTTLLDVLASRVTVGVISGEMLIDGKHRDGSFQRKTGYAQQQDLHLQTATVREALRFSALLRQPGHIAHQEKLDYAEEIIKLLDMAEYADAVIGVPGEGLNVEQRKRLTIGVELAAKPALLLFLDEPTSGLDSQTSWNILDLLHKLKNNGQAILCTIHQPSAMLFQRFDHLLFLRSGGQTVYFGDIGKGSQILIDYFVRNGGHPCPPGENPAEWMLDVIGAAPGSHSDIDWHQTWRNSPEYSAVQDHLVHLAQERLRQTAHTEHQAHEYDEFAVPFSLQFREVLLRTFQQIWRTPSYIYSKTAMVGASGLVVGFSLFNTPNSIQGLQNQLFSIFMILTIFTQLCQILMPHFVTQRSLYEVRERPSKTYDWKAFMMSNILVEIPWSILLSVVLFTTWYYPIGLYRNAIPTDEVALRGALVWLFCLSYLIFGSTFGHMLVSGFEDYQEGGNISVLLFLLCFLFCGVLVTPDQLPRFWIFMYRVSPFTYLVGGMLSAGVANADIVCAANEYLRFDPPPNGTTCGEYVAAYQLRAGGYVLDPAATSDCRYCPVADTNSYLRTIHAEYKDAWRNFGLIWVYIVVNIAMAVLLYYLFRVPKAGGIKKQVKWSASDSGSSTKEK